MRALPSVTVLENEPLAAHTRFAVGGPADLLIDAGDEASFVHALLLCRALGIPHGVLGAGSNVIASDEGFRGALLRFSAAAVERTPDGLVHAQTGASLQSLVSFTVERGLEGLHTLERIPGSVGGAVYGNAGAYGHSMHQFVRRARYVDARGVWEIDNAACEFDYRESVFKRHKDRAILSCSLELPAADPEALAAEALEIRKVRDEKFPPSMRCAGSIFKNLFLANLPAGAADEVPLSVVREGKVAAAWFLEQVGAKGLREGGVRIAHYHANLIYNPGQGTAAELRTLIAEVKRRVLDRFGFELEEEVQYLGF
ncbi:MAG: UDP-N-acetylmuramate dehydrogenase [Acidobacteria bacterium]|nr:UDP-N-acetylmuramate dehydrogenase [Acidobacteriota bacterium]